MEKKETATRKEARMKYPEQSLRVTEKRIGKLTFPL